MEREFASRLALIAFGASLAGSCGTGATLTDSLWTAFATGACFGLIGLPWGYLAARLAEETAAVRVARMFAEPAATPAPTAPMSGTR